MARLVAAMFLRAAKSLAAASANSAAFAAYARTCVAETGLVRACLAMARSRELSGGQTMNDLGVASNLSPQRASAAEFRSGLDGSDFEHLHCVAGEPCDASAPVVQRVRPGLIVIVDVDGTNHDEVDVARRPCLAAGERTEHEDAGWRSWHRRCEPTHLAKDEHVRLGYVQEKSRGDVVGNQSEECRRRDVSSRYYTQFDQFWQHARCLRCADPAEPRNRPEVELGGGARENGQDSPLNTGYECLDRAHEIHAPTLAG